MKLDELKKQYAELAHVHKLPNFDKACLYFELDRIDRDCVFLLREIRKTVLDKVIETTRLVEMLINPSQAPPMFLHFVKQISSNEKVLLEQIYEGFVKLELEALENDISYRADAEAELIRNTFDFWENNVLKIREIISMMKKNFSQTSVKKEKSYLG
ncbi:MAG: hypothetical protein AABW79_01150 [Nanoarchaeota archaeon]